MPSKPKKSVFSPNVTQVVDQASLYEAPLPSTASLSQAPSPPPPPPAHYPHYPLGAGQSMNSLILSDENFDPRFQVSVAAVVARHTVIPPGTSLEVDTNLCFSSKIHNFALYFSALPAFQNVSNQLPYVAKNDYFLKPLPSTRLRIAVINGSDTEFTLATDTVLGNLVFFPFDLDATY